MKQVAAKTHIPKCRSVIILLVVFTLVVGTLFILLLLQQNQRGILMDPAQLQISNMLNQFNVMYVGTFLAGLGVSLILLCKLQNAYNNLEQGDIKFRMLFDALPDATMIVDHRGIIRMTNSLLENIFGYDKEEMKNEFIEVLMPCNFFVGTITFWMDKNQYDYKTKVFNKEGDNFEIMIYLTPMHFGKERLTVARIRRLSFPIVPKKISASKLYISSNIHESFK